MKIAELCLSPDLGGLELYVGLALEELSKKNSVVGIFLKNGKLDQKYCDKNYQIFTTQKTFYRFPILRAIEIAKIIDKENIDILHIHWSKDLFLAVLIKKFSKRKPKIFYYRQMKIPDYKTTIYHKFIFSNVDMMGVITKNLKNEAIKYLPPFFSEKIQLLYYGVKPPRKYLTPLEKNSLKKENGFETNDFVVGIFGRIEKQKGQYLVIESIKNLSSRYKDLKCFVVGRAMEKSYLDELKNIDHKHTVYKDFVTNVADYMQICDVVVLATKEETFGLVIAEAMLCKVCVVGSNRGGVVEMIKDGHSGKLFNSMEQQSLEEKIEFLLNNLDLKEQMVQNGYDMAIKKFEYKKHWRKLEELFVKLLE